MTKSEINKLISEGEFPEETVKRELIETHISWVILCDEFVYKIKKPMRYSFLDFSSLPLRKHYCEREVELNRRITPNVYLGVEPIMEHQGNIAIGGKEGTVLDYAVKMRKLDVDKRMDKLLAKNEITANDIKNLAEKIASFHKRTTIIHDKNLEDIRGEFNDLETGKEYVNRALGLAYGAIIDEAVEFSNYFLDRHKDLLARRLKEGYYRDCHGDLHSRNIFMLPEPMPFDCIEFNDDFRQIDVLNEVAFLCMDLDAFGRHDLSERFLESYNHFFPALNTSEDRELFVYYKAYRANIRAKVNGLRAQNADTDEARSDALSAAEKYLTLMAGYLEDH